MPGAAFCLRSPSPHLLPAALLCLFSVSFLLHLLSAGRVFLPSLLRRAHFSATRCVSLAIRFFRFVFFRRFFLRLLLSFAFPGCDACAFPLPCYTVHIFKLSQSYEHILSRKEVFAMTDPGTLKRAGPHPACPRISRPHFARQRKRPAFGGKERRSPQGRHDADSGRSGLSRALSGGRRRNFSGRFRLSLRSAHL